MNISLALKNVIHADQVLMRWSNRLPLISAGIGESHIGSVKEVRKGPRKK